MPAEIKDLPKETLLSILGYLDIRSLCRMACTNVRFKTLAYDPSLYTELNLNGKTSYAIYNFWRSRYSHGGAVLASRCNMLRKVDVSDSENIRGKLRKFVNVAMCRLTHLYADSVDINLPYCSQLVDVSLCMHTNSVTQLMHCHKLLRLNLFFSIVNTEDLTIILKQNRSLKHLNISECFELTNIEYVTQILTKYNSSLETLMIKGLKPMTFRVIDNIARLTHLKELGVTDTLGIDEKMRNSFVNLFGCCQQLQKLDLAICHQVTSNEIQVLVNKCPDITHLNITECSNLRIDFKLGCDILSNLKHLKKINLDTCFLSEKEVNDLKETYQSVNINYQRFR